MVDARAPEPTGALHCVGRFTLLICTSSGVHKV
jgi:hypothetical protein